MISSIIYFLSIAVSHTPDSNGDFRTYESRMFEALLSLSILGMLCFIFISPLFMRVEILTHLYINDPQVYHQMIGYYNKAEMMVWFVFLLTTWIAWDGVVLLSGGNPNPPYYW